MKILKNKKSGEEVDYDPDEDMRLRKGEEQLYWGNLDHVLEELEEGK